MKPGILAILLAAITLSACSSTASTARKEKAAVDFAKTADLVESGNFQFTVNSASPTGARTVQLSTLYTMKAKDGNYEAYLPYFGRAYSGGYTGDGGVEFNGEPVDLQIIRNDDKNKISVTFSIRSDQDLYKVSLNLGASGYGNLIVNSQKRQSISYNGLLSELPD